MAVINYDIENIDIAWCPGCGNHSILKILKQVLIDLQKDPLNVVMVSGIGQAAKIPQYIKTNYFNGLHGRALPPATGIKASNPGLTVIAESGDGDMYGEGGNHFIHAIRRNTDITNIVHNNMVYGLTKGQASPTSNPGFVTPVQNDGVSSLPFNPLAVAVSLGAGFVARIFCGDFKESVETVKKAILHKGYALVDVLQPCVVFNKVNTYKWFKENSYYIDNNHDTKNRFKAFEKAIETEKLPLGIIYINEEGKTFEENLRIHHDKITPQYSLKPDSQHVKTLLKTFYHT
ncbi:MAG: 2-oxoacid ferredoxin oxidoreductase [Oligoflexia bacterium]|nr:2-oxoacid ferredoxin oxidoreductase [Oligoflexia bacterium]